MKSLTKIYTSFISLFLMLVLCISTNIVAFATNSYDKNGLYDVPITKKIAMGGSNFSDNVAVKKQNDDYFMTFTILKNEKFKDLKLKIENAFVDEVVDGEKTRYTYKLTKEQLYSELFFSVYIIKMGMIKDFSIELHNDEARLVEIVEDVIPKKEYLHWIILGSVVGVALTITISVIVIKKKKNKK